MEDLSTLQQEIRESYEANKAYEARKAAEYRKDYEASKAADDLQQAKLKALQNTIGNYGNFRYADLEDFIDPDNQNWADYEYGYKLPSFFKRQGRVGAASPIGIFISHIRDAENIDDVKKQLELWNSYKPLDLPHNGESYVNHFLYGLSNADYGGSRPIFPTTDESDPVKTTASGVQGMQGTQGVQGAKTGNAVAKGGTQGSNNGSGGAQAGNGTYASADVAKGGTKTIGYDPNPGNVSLAYAMRNAPEQERRTALINKWNQENGISYATGKDGLIYRTDPQHPNGYVDPFKNDLSKTGSTGYATGQGMLTSGSNGTYATGEGIKDANGNVLTNPGGDWEYQYALKNPQYGLGMMGKMSDAQKNYLQAVSNNMGYNYNFTGATRFV